MRQSHLFLNNNVRKEFTISKDLYYDIAWNHWSTNLSKDVVMTIMTDNLLEKLEEKMMVLLTEVEISREEHEKSKERISFMQLELENLRNEVQRLNADNSSLRYEREGHARKIQDILSLLESVSVAEAATTTTMAAVKPMLVQG